MAPIGTTSCDVAAAQCHNPPMLYASTSAITRDRVLFHMPVYTLWKGKVLLAVDEINIVSLSMLEHHQSTMNQDSGCSVGFDRYSWFSPYCDFYGEPSSIRTGSGAAL
jgi:hypothetical protein